MAAVEPKSVRARCNRVIIECLRVRARTRAPKISTLPSSRPYDGVARHFKGMLHHCNGEGGGACQVRSFVGDGCQWPARCSDGSVGWTTRGRHQITIVIDVTTKCVIKGYFSGCC